MEETTTKVKVQTSQLTASFKKVLETVKSKGARMYPWKGLGPEEMREYVNEISRGKRRGRL